MKFRPASYPKCTNPHLPLRVPQKVIKQIKQWEKVFSMVRQYEAKAKKTFVSVIKLRPDDLWFGAMVPQCTLDLRKTVYISRQKTRWSDQWFILPRSFAEKIMNIASRSEKIRPRSNNLQGECSIPFKPGNGFEIMFFEYLKNSAHSSNMKISATLYPRILARVNVNSLAAHLQPRAKKDIDDKCKRFLWNVGTQLCRDVVNGPLKRNLSQRLFDDDIAVNATVL